MNPRIAVALRKAGIEVSTTVERGLRGEDDANLLEFTTAEGRVLVTDDTDFLRLARASSDHGGIVFCFRMRHSIGRIVEFLALLHLVSDAAEMRGRVEYLG